MGLRKIQRLRGASDRDFAIHYARVLIAQARAFRLRGTPDARRFALTLLDWAAKRRERARL